MSVIYIARKEFESWMELNEVDIFKAPSHNSTAVVCSGQLPNGVRFSFNATAILITDAGSVYGRRNDWNAIKVAKF